MAFTKSSGNLSADRRLSYAEAMLADGDAAGAATLMLETLADCPDWVGGWVRAGEMAQAANMKDDAARAYTEALRLDPADHFGASLRLDLLRPVQLSDRAPSAHVEALFDESAHRFEKSLVGKLGYTGPELVASRLDGHYANALDLGCGTGLAGVAIAPRCDRIVGYDISTKMLEEARRKGVYADLQQQDLAALELTGAAWDLIVAADVFIYLGALERIIGWIADALNPGGKLVFTVEERTDGAGYNLQQSFRYAHARSYLEEVLTAAGFNDYKIEPVVLRHDRGQPIHSLIVTATAGRSAREGFGEGLTEVA